MKILYIIDNFDTSFNYREVHYARESAKNNEVYVLTSTNSFCSSKKFKEGVTKWGNVKIIRKKPFFRIKDIFLWIRGYKKEIKKINPDIIHTFEGVKISTSIMGVWAKKQGYPLVCDQENRISGGREFLTWLKYWVCGRFFEKKLVKASDLIQVVTEGGKEYLINNFKIPQSKILQSNLGCLKSQFYFDKNLRKNFREKNASDKNKFIIGVSGKFREWKKIETIISAFKKTKDDSYRLFIFGSFDSNYLAKIKEECDDSRIVIKEGFMNIKDLNEFYNGVDVMCWTHVTISLFESLATKTPVIIPYFNATNHLEKMNGVFFYGKNKKIFDKNEHIINFNERIKEIFKIIKEKPKFNGEVDSRIYWENIVSKLNISYLKLLNEKNKK